MEMVEEQLEEFKQAQVTFIDEEDIEETSFS